MLSVKIEKLNIMPSVIPKGFLCPPVVEDDKIIGKSGQIHGARMVTRPEIKAKRRRINMIILEQRPLALQTQLCPSCP